MLNDPNILKLKFYNKLILNHKIILIKILYLNFFNPTRDLQNILKYKIKNL